MAEIIKKTAEAKAAALPKLTADMEIIGKLDDLPNDVNGLTGKQLRDRFDEAGKTVKRYVNEELLPALEGPGGLVPEEIEEHNVAPDAHQDIRQEIADNAAAIAKKLDSATIKSAGIPEISSVETLRTYFYDRRKDTSRNWQFEVSTGSNENIISALGGFPDGHTAAEKWFLYITLPYTEAGGFVIHAQLEGRDNGKLYRQDQFSTLDQRWHTSGWIQIENVQKHLDEHIEDQTNPHNVTYDQTGADKAGAADDAQAAAIAAAKGTVIVADCFDEAASPTSQPNTWYVPKTAPRPTGEAGMTIDVRWQNGHVGGLGYNISLVWGAPGGGDNETILASVNSTANLTGEYSIPAEGTVRYQLEEKDDRQHWRYVSGPVIPRQFSSAAAAGVADKPVHGMEIEYLPGMEIYVQLDNGNTADVMRLVPDAGQTLPVYGNGIGATTGTLPAGCILHLVNAGAHWQIINGGAYSGGGEGGKDEVYIGPDPAPAGTEIQIDPDSSEEIYIPEVLQDANGESTTDTVSQKVVHQLNTSKADKTYVDEVLGNISTLVGGGL